MLVLTRKLGQQIQIGDEITLTVLRVHGQTVRFGIQAPEDIKVLRHELTSQTPARTMKSSDVRSSSSALRS